MAEELLEFENTVEDADGTSWVAVVMGAERDDGRWIGWIRFAASGGADVLTTDRETTQPNRADLAYWASGLTYFYLEGALARARRRQEQGTGTGERAAAMEAARSAEPRIPDGRVPRLELVSLDDRVAEVVMGVREPRPGTMRRVPDAGTVIYEGVAREGNEAVHRFAVQAGDGTARSNMANWLWSRVHRSGAEARVHGSGRLQTNADLRQALES